MKRAAAKSTDATSNVVAHALGRASEAVRANLPKISSLSRCVRRVRTQAIGGPAEPSNREEIFLPREFQETETGARFLFRDTGGPERMLMFATRKNLQVNYKFVNL